MDEWDAAQVRETVLQGKVSLYRTMMKRLAMRREGWICAVRSEQGRGGSHYTGTNSDLEGAVAWAS
jgi:hypothetical protein